MHASVTNDERRLDAASAHPASVTGVARGGQGTGTALDDTQVYNVADLTAAPIEPAGSQVARESAPEPMVAEAVPVSPEPPAPAAPVPPSTPRVATRRRTPSEGTSRTRTPVAGLIGVAIAAVLAILVGASLGGMDVGGGANGDATLATATQVPAETEAKDDDDDGGGEGGGNGKGNKDCKGQGNENGNGNGNCDDD